MRFQNYCESIGDDQSVTLENTLTLTFKNKSGEVFSIPPASIRGFLIFVRDNYDELKDVWSRVPSRRSSISQYEEKSYREIYKAAKSDEFKIVSSMGSSQTKSLTRVISKIIGFLNSLNYESIEDNTFFQQDYINVALDNWDALSSEIHIGDELDFSVIQKKFRDWLISQGRSERTARSYSVTAIAKCDSYIDLIDVNATSFYQLEAHQILEGVEKLKLIDEFASADLRGNSMYSAACKSLAKFFSVTPSVSTILVKTVYQSRAFRLPKNFLLLAGISGTGKTRFIREQSKASGAFPSTYCLTSVRPDWHEPSDLLGYISRLSGNAEYVTTDVLKFIAKAWRAIADANLTFFAEGHSGQDSQVKVRGGREQIDQVLPYWLCLDEMNLAPVEQYFADYLSVIETREWHWNGDEFTYMSDALLKPAFIAELSDESKQKLRDDLGFSEEKYAELWGIISQYGMGIPFNLMVAGTVNMDETTHGFSRKVIDRALSFDFGEFFPNNYNEFFSPSDRVKRLSYPTLSNVTQADLTGTIDSDGKQSIAFLSGVNEVLRKTPFELAYRALNELLLAVASVKPQDKLTLTAVWDDFVMCKVLPRIEGDTDKLQDAEGRSLLTELQTQLTKYFAALEEPTDTSEQRLRPDLYREKIIGDNTHEQDGLIYIPFRSTAKLAWMIKRLEASSFTSFWP